jgi:hypothetical protein
MAEETEQFADSGPIPKLLRGRSGRLVKNWAVLLGALVMLAGALWVSVGGEEVLFSTPAIPVFAQVIEVLAAKAEEGPPTYAYRVSLPDGRHGLYCSERAYRVGSRVKVLYSRGKLSARTFLTTPESPTP